MEAAESQLRISDPSGLLSSSRQDMYSALSIFAQHVEHAITLMVAVLAGAFAIVGFAISQNVQQGRPIVALVGAVLILVIVPLSALNAAILRRYYELYVAALIYTTDLHDAVQAGVALPVNAHPWFDDLKADFSDENAHARLKRVRARASARRHSGGLYTLLLLWFATVGTLSGVGLVLYSIYAA